MCLPFDTLRRARSGTGLRALVVAAWIFSFSYMRPVLCSLRAFRTHDGSGTYSFAAAGQQEVIHALPNTPWAGDNVQCPEPTILRRFVLLDVGFCSVPAKTSFIVIKWTSGTFVISWQLRKL